MQRNRPKNLNLLSIRLPLPALVSILHRTSGFLLFLALPLILLALQYSLQSALRFQQLADILSHPIVKFLLVVTGWAFIHHFLAGIRHLAMDVHWGTTLPKARASAKMVMVLSAVLTILTAIWLW
jgi:succinate dehydrogenase / fumarate reductase cytochrome b subunit